jgi:hypothetical protein
VRAWTFPFVQAFPSRVCQRPPRFPQSRQFQRKDVDGVLRADSWFKISITFTGARAPTTDIAISDNFGTVGSALSSSSTPLRVLDRELPT